MNIAEIVKLTADAAGEAVAAPMSDLDERIARLEQVVQHMLDQRLGSSEKFDATQLLNGDLDVNKLPDATKKAIGRAVQKAREAEDEMWAEWSASLGDAQRPATADDLRKLGGSR